MNYEQEAIWFQDHYEKIRIEIGRHLIGQNNVVKAALFGLIAQRHILLEGMPGLGKSLLVKTIGQSLSITTNRIQFTPDLMPADITGTQMLNEGRMEFRNGPVFANLVMADEINRATPKTQSAMLEAMQEASVTVFGQRYDLPKPFVVMATQNPIEQEGTYPLPEAQLDRFLMKVVIDFPNKEELSRIVNLTTGTESPDINVVSSVEELIRMQQLAIQVAVAPEIQDFALELVLGTHPDIPGAPDMVKKYVRYGASPRGAQSLMVACKIQALLDRRFHVSKDDIVAWLKPTLRHRLLLNFEAVADGITADEILESMVSTSVGNAK